MQAVATEAPVQVEVPTLAPTATPRPAAEASSAGAAGTTGTEGTKAGQTWTVLLYQDADDQVLEKDIMTDLNEAERVGSTDRVNIVSQIDRYKGAYSGDGNWDDTRRYYIKQDQDLNKLNSQLLQKGEANMSDGNTLVDFVKWGMENYPADKYVLVLSDHGMGWPGGWSDPNPGGAGPRGIPLARAMGDDLYLMELDDALATIQRETGLEKFEIIGMDACLMSHLEVFNALEPYARYAVASQETEPALGWAYTAFLDTLTKNPDINGADLSQVHRRHLHQRRPAHRRRPGACRDAVARFVPRPAGRPDGGTDCRPDVARCDADGSGPGPDSGAQRCGEQLCRGGAAGGPTQHGQGAPVCAVLHQHLWLGGTAFIH